MPPIQAHTNRLEQVIFNLLTNARDALGQKPEGEDDANEHRWICVATGSENSRGVLNIADNGSGISQDVPDRIFRSFIAIKGMGAGMGLVPAISPGIVENCGGVIDVQSRAGDGARFQLSFPAAT